MTSDKRPANWDDIKTRIKAQWPTLDDESLDATDGDREQLIGLLEARLGYARGNAEGDVDTLLREPVDERATAWSAEAAESAADRPEDGVLEVDGRGIHYLDWGNADAPPLLLIHGMAGCAADWVRVAAHLQSRYHVIGIDQRGHGESSWVEGSQYTTAGFVADIDALVDHLGIAPFVMVAHSMGGHNGMAYAARYPDKVRCAVINDVPAQIEKDMIRSRTRFADVGQPIFNHVDEYIERVRDDISTAPDWALYSIAGDRLRELPDGRLQPKADPAAMMYWEPDDLRAELARIECPVLFIVAGKARLLDDRMVDELGSAIPRFQSVMLPNAGHHTFLDDEAAFFEAIDPFLEQHAPGKQPDGA